MERFTQKDIVIARELGILTTEMREIKQLLLQSMQTQKENKQTCDDKFEKQDGRIRRNDKLINWMIGVGGGLNFSLIVLGILMKIKGGS